MTRTIQLFMSSSPDLLAAREALGRAVAELPVTTGWELKHTPEVGADIREELAFISRCDIYVIALGADFAAPMGLEWQTALKAGSSMLYFCRQGPHSPSARELLRQSTATWTEFESPQELEGYITQALAKFLLDYGEQLRLHMTDVKGLLVELAKTQVTRGDQPDQRQGAGRGGVILSSKV